MTAVFSVFSCFWAFFLFFYSFEVIEWGWAWGVLSPMTAGSVGAFFIYFKPISMLLNGGGRGLFIFTSFCDCNVTESDASRD